MRGDSLPRRGEDGATQRHNFNDVAKDSLDEWIYLLKNSEIKHEFQARGLTQAKDNLKVENLSPAEKAAYQKISLYIKDMK